MTLRLKFAIHLCHWRRKSPTHLRGTALAIKRKSRSVASTLQKPFGSLDHKERKSNLSWKAAPEKYGVRKNEKGGKQKTYQEEGGRGRGCSPKYPGS